jgi:[acyl-carrier-protein] S-malonyltransferase
MTLEPGATAFVFPGQGSQAVGMGRDLAAAFPEACSIFEEADSILGIGLSKLMWEGPETELNDTINTQPALFVHSLAAYRVLRTVVPALAPAYMAGHSLGELSAITAAGALTFEDGLRLVRTRGTLMKRAGDLRPGGMAAVIGLDIPTLDKVCAEASTGGEIVQVANDNCPGQVVISGHKTALERAVAGSKSAGAKRALPLAISIAAHSPLMDSIQHDWESAVRGIAYSEYSVPIIGNVYAAPIVSAGDLQDDIVAQMQSRVRWTESVKLMIGHGVKTFVEIGTGTVLCGLIKRIDGNVSALPLGGPQDFDKIK